MEDYPVMGANGHLAPNDIWNIPPAPQNEVRGSLKTYGPWQIARSYRALAMDMHGRVFGIRTMSNVRESGYELEGRVSIEGRKYRAFTSSKLFSREDGSLCDVAIVYVCGTPDYQWSDPAKDPALCEMLGTRYHYEREGTYKDLCEYCRCLQSIASGWADQYPHCQYRERAQELRAALAPAMGWTL